MKKSKKINIIDLFAGCGGLVDGFEKTNYFNSLAAVEWDAACCNTLKKRLSEKWNYKNANEIVMHFDIQRIKELLNGWKNDPIFGSHVGLKKLVGSKKVDIIIGGPPCQAYSVAGRARDKDGMKNDYRNYLFESYLNVVKHFKPKIFIFENVQGMLSAKPGGILIIDRIKEAFNKAGYLVADDLKRDALFDVSDFEIPQVRKRLIILGVNKEIYGKRSEEVLKNFYNNLSKNKSEKKKTVSDAILDLPKLFPNKNFSKDKNKKSHIAEEKGKIANHEPRYHSQRDINIFNVLAKDIETGLNKYSKISEIKKLYTKMTGKKSNVHKYFVLRKDGPSNTIPAHLYKDGLRHIHPDSKQSRSITVREAARLQAFDDDFIFCGSQGDQYKMIGNAVPPKFSNIVAKSLLKIINN